MRALLITGGAGFIGSNFVRYWLREHPGDRVVVLDALTYAGNLMNLAGLGENERLAFVRGDIRDRALVERLLREEEIGTIVHLAAESHVDRSIAGPGVFLDTNVNGTHALLEAARTVWLDGGGREHRFHHVSTDEVYGSLGPDDAPFTESSPYAPSSPYAASKAASDFLVRAYHRTYGLHATISNCSNNYGPYHFPEKLIPLMIVNVLRGLPLPVYGDGANVRDWLHVHDHCRGLERVLMRGRIGRTYNIGGGSEQRNLDVVRGVCALVDEAFEHSSQLAAAFPQAPPASGRRSAELISFVTDRPGHDFRYAIDASRMRDELEFEPTVDFSTGLRDTVRWYVDNGGWWQAIIRGAYRDVTSL
jgi:dTDP-glucose 4,6-dehydratase